MKIARAAWALPWALPLFWTGCSDETLIDPTANAGTGGTSGASGAAGTSTSGSAGTATSGGTAGTTTSGGTAGTVTSGGSAGTVTTSGGTSGTAGGGAGGTGNAGAGGTPPQGGTAGTATSGGTAGTQAGSAGDGGTAGTMAGAGGTAGDTAGTAGTAGTGGNLEDIAADLHGHTILMPCGQDTSTRVCRPQQVNQGCSAGNDPALAGGHSHNQTVTIGGTPGTFYNVTLRIHGMVEGKSYRNGGMDRDNSADLPADGLYTGGEPDNQANGYNVYMIRTSSPAQDYFLNSIGTANDQRIRHSVFEIDFEFDLRVEGGSTVQLVSADPNCSAIKNCEEPDVGTVCNPVTINGVDPLISADIGSQPYNGQFVGVLVQGVTVAQ
jgi:hypothetical protein